VKDQTIVCAPLHRGELDSFASRIVSDVTRSAACAGGGTGGVAAGVRGAAGMALDCRAHGGLPIAVFGAECFGL